MTEEPGPFLRTRNSRILLIDPDYVLTSATGENGKDSAKGSNPTTGRRWTQTDQDETDAELRRRVMKDLVHSWMDRLQLISVITTFFAATEAQLLGFTTPDDTKHVSLVQQAANTILAGALVIHLSAAIISFLAAFFLVRYRLKEAKREELKVELGVTPNASQSGEAPVWTSDPHLEQVGPFRRGKPPTHLLEHCHSICMWLAAVGFILALTGVLCYSWAMLPRSAGIFASVVMAVCWIACAGAIFLVL